MSKIAKKSRKLQTRKSKSNKSIMDMEQNIATWVNDTDAPNMKEPDNDNEDEGRPESTDTPFSLVATDSGPLPPEAVHPKHLERLYHEMWNLGELTNNEQMEKYADLVLRLFSDWQMQSRVSYIRNRDDNTWINLEPTEVKKLLQNTQHKRRNDPVVLNAQLEKVHKASGHITSYEYGTGIPTSHYGAAEISFLCKVYEQYPSDGPTNLANHATDHLKREGLEINRSWEMMQGWFRNKSKQVHRGLSLSGDQLIGNLTDDPPSKHLNEKERLYIKQTILANFHESPQYIATVLTTKEEGECWLGRDTDTLRVTVLDEQTKLNNGAPVLKKGTLTPVGSRSNYTNAEKAFLRKICLDHPNANVSRIVLEAKKGYKGRSLVDRWVQSQRTWVLIRINTQCVLVMARKFGSMSCVCS